MGLASAKVLRWEHTCYVRRTAKEPVSWNGKNKGEWKQNHVRMSPLGNRISFVFTLREKRSHCRPLGRGPMRSNLCFYRITPAARGTGSSGKITSEAIANVPERDVRPLNQVSGNEGNNGKLSKWRLILQVERRGLVEGHTQSMKEQEDQGWWPRLLTWN